MINLFKRLCLCVFLLGLPAADAGAGEVLRVGAYQNPPNVFAAPDGPTTGMFPEMLDDIGAKYGWRIEYIHGTWEECLKRLGNGEIDLLVDVAVSDERRAL